MQRSRKQVKELKDAAKIGDAEAAKSLLAHSLSVGHGRLSVSRYFAAHPLGAAGLDLFRESGFEVARRIPPREVFRVVRQAYPRVSQQAETAQMLRNHVPTAPFILPFEGVSPKFKGDRKLCGQATSVLGKVTIGTRATLAPHSVIRADGHFVEVGDDFYLGERATVHIAHEVYPTRIGDRVYVGRNAVVHACTVGDDCVIEDDVIILDGSEVEAHVLIEAGSTVYPRSKLLSGHVYAGTPAAPVARLSDATAATRASKIKEGIVASLFASSNIVGSERGAASNFVARTASLTGHVDLRESASVFFSCNLDAGEGAIIVRDNTNVQDNTLITARREGVIIGSDTTIGHNVAIEEARIGDRCLIGIGSRVAASVVVENEVLLAGGSTTSPGQRLESGWLYAGRPAKPISKLDDGKRAMMRSIVEIYCSYARAYQAQQCTGGT